VTRLPSTFFERNTLQVARDLLGQRLVRVVDGHRLSGLIVEAEAYIGENDLACHASRGRTPRTEVMFGPPGRAYIYFIYGMYYCLNVVTEPEGFPAAVLIRALEPEDGRECMRERRSGRPDRELLSGPGKLCAALDIDKRLNHVDLTQDDRLFLEIGPPVDAARVTASPRIGINIPGEASEQPWRFYLADSPFVSRQPARRR
jgi:DNA-3-methyladenine glycosylase